MSDLTQRFFDRFGASIRAGLFRKITLGHPKEKEAPLRKVLFRPVLIKGEPRCSVVKRFSNRDETKNPTFEEAFNEIEKGLGTDFLSLHLQTESEEVQLELGNRRPRMKVKACAVSPETSPRLLGHDRVKARKLDPTAPWLRGLGVTDAKGRVRERMGDKFRQIERFLDLLDAAIKESGSLESPVTLCDMGSGKGYLTFAAYDYLQQSLKGEVRGVGVEAREDLVKLCNQVAEDSQFSHLQFVESRIEDYSLPPLQILVALHACNTATDDALFAGIQAGASVLLVAPCCHKEARPQVDAASSEGPLREVLRYGLFAERHAEMATDALRALLLEWAGYRVKVAEFVSAEHTAKNVMLIATRRTQGGNSKSDLEKRIAALKSFYGIQHHRLEALLFGRG